MARYSEENLLSVRLKCVFDSIPEDTVKSRFIDVGSDHGHLTCYALMYGGYKTSVSTDIHKEPAEKTRQFLLENSLDEVSTVVCTDGLNGIDLKVNDVVVMAGLGGNNIIDIIGRAIEITDDSVLKTVTWVLQPQKSIEALRVFLADNGIDVNNEVVCLDRDIYYNIIVARFTGIKRSISLTEKYYGNKFLECLRNNPDDELLGGYIKLLDERYTLRSRGDSETKQMLMERGLL